MHHCFAEQWALYSIMLELIRSIVILSSRKETLAGWATHYVKGAKLLHGDAAAQRSSVDATTEVMLLMQGQYGRQHQCSTIPRSEMPFQAWPRLARSNW